MFLSFSSTSPFPPLSSPINTINNNHIYPHCLPHVRRYTYLRTGRSLVATYFISAFWHGLYPGFFLFFMSIPLMTNIERLIKVEPHIIVPYYIYFTHSLSFFSNFFSSYMSPSYLAPLIDAFSFLFLTTTYHSFPSVSTVKDKSNPSTRIWRLRHQDLSFFLLCHVLLGVQLVLHNSHYELCSTGEQLWCYYTWQWLLNRWCYWVMSSSACTTHWRIRFFPPLIPFIAS